MERDDRQEVCANGHSIDQYPETYNGGERLGVNFKGYVEYWHDDHIREILYSVRNQSISEMNTHDTLAENKEQHIRASAERFGDWWMIE